MKQTIPAMKTTFKHLLAIVTIAMCSAVLGQASQTLPSGSFLGLKAQVVAPATSPTINSTHAISSNDFVQWTAYFQSKMTSPFQSDGVMTLPANFKWQNGSVFVPANTVLRWNVGGVWQTTEPPTGTMITQVGWKTDPLIKITVQPAVAGLVSFQGTGDGYRVIAYKDKLFVVNHHTQTTYLNCRVAENGSPCPGFASSGLSISRINGVDAAMGAGFETMTPNRSIEHLNATTGELFLYLGGIDSGIPNAQVMCVNLDTLKSCMNAVIMQTGVLFGQDSSSPIGSVGSKYYAVSSNGKLLCFDTAIKLPCAGQPFDYGWTGHVHSASNSTIMGGKLIASWDDTRVRCVDTIANHTPCADWGIVQFSANAVFPALNANGTARGVCSRQGCRGLDGASFLPSINYNVFLNANLFWGSGWYADANTYGTRVFHSLTGAQGSYASCFDFATDSVCPNFPLLSSIGEPATYSVVKDSVRSNCMWSLGDRALAKSFNPLTGGDCPSNAVIPPTLQLNVEPAINYRCDPTAARVDRWGKVRFSPALAWGSNGLSSVKAKIMDWAGTVLPAQYNPNRDFTYGAFELSIADIPYALYPKLKIELTIAAGTQAITAEIGFDVTWEGDPTQLCFKTQAPPVDNCGLGASVTLQTKAVHIANYNETLNASTGFTPNALQFGWGPRTSATTLSEKLTGLDITQVLQTRFNMNNYTGDLWQFPIGASGVLAGSPSNIASSNTGNRTFYTSTPGSGTGGMALVSLNYSALNATQKAALNQTILGITDTLGPQRVDYLKGNRSLEASTNDTPPTGKLRKRTNNLLGPVIDSSPTVLMRAPLAGYNDVQYPNYNAYKTSNARANTLALYAGNDGFLHAYKVSPTSGLSQAFSFMPSTVLNRIQTYTDSGLAGAVLNPYRLDNTPMVADVNLATSKTGNQWRTVVVGNQGRGGRGVYALDISSGNPDGILFDYDNTTHPDLVDLGQMQGQPPSDMVTGADQIVRIGSDARWAYIAGNGFGSNGGNPANSGTGRAVLYIFYLNGNVNGANQRWKRISVNQTANPDADLDFGNGLGTPRPVDTDGDGVVDLVYAGDQKGNLWRFNVRDLNNVTVTKIFKTPSVVAFAGQVAASQPIYTAPVVQQFGGAGKCPANKAADCWMVLFGTGGDVSGTITPLHTSNSLAPQQFYGVFDKGELGAAGLVDETSLTAQTIGASAATVGSVRTVSNNPVDYAGGKRGWKIALSLGEHTTANPEIQANGSIMFASSRPAGMALTSCAPGLGWLTQVTASTGGGKANAFKNSAGNQGGASVVINAGTGTFAVPNTLLGKTLNSRTHKLLISGAVGTLGTGSGIDVSTITQSTDIMVGRMSWREVFGAPK